MHGYHKGRRSSNYRRGGETETIRERRPGQCETHLVSEGCRPAALLRGPRLLPYSTALRRQRRRRRRRGEWRRRLCLLAWLGSCSAKLPALRICLFEPANHRYQTAATADADSRRSHPCGARIGNSVGTREDWSMQVLNGWSKPSIPYLGTYLPDVVLPPSFSTD
ncbi:hypothetical protein F4803DRAFT_10616 [Xylaria telfairii]|nr:hypothetical protein F4803DRAFT_10616 [Xylaria telfairii]